MILKNIGALICGCVLAFGSSATADVQKCVMRVPTGTNAGWIAPEILLSFDEASKTMMVYDGLIAYFNKEKPIQAKIATEKPVSRSFDWSVQMVNSQGQRTNMQYHGTLFQATKEFHVTARPVGYRDVFSAVGNCAPSKG